MRELCPWCSEAEGMVSCYCFGDGCGWSECPVTAKAEIYFKPPVPRFE